LAGKVAKKVAENCPTGSKECEKMGEPVADEGRITGPEGEQHDIEAEG
jgi:hypothetical protein